MATTEINWTAYMRYRTDLRGFTLAKLEHILRSSTERYFDVETGRSIVVGHHDENIVLIAYETNENLITPVTVHTTTRQQINFRLKTERLIYE